VRAIHTSVHSRSSTFICCRSGATERLCRAYWLLRSARFDRGMKRATCRIYWSKIPRRCQQSLVLVPTIDASSTRRQRWQRRAAGMVLRHLNREAVYSGPPDAKKLSAAGRQPIWQRPIIENCTEDWRTDVYLLYTPCIYRFSTSRHRKTTGRISCSWRWLSRG